MSATTVRRRKVQQQDESDHGDTTDSVQESCNVKKELSDMKITLQLEAGSYWLTRIFFLRFLGFIYAVAFLVGYHQNIQLIGQKGLLPAANHLKKIWSHTGGSLFQSLNYAPTLLWFVNYEDHMDLYLTAISLCGLMLSLLLVVLGSANMLMMSVLWVLYHSLVNVGQRWYSFGWESQLLESGFLAIFFCPLLSLRPVPRKTPPSWAVIWGYRWLIFRIMLGAGLIKIRGDQCWRDLTCMNYHYETQPVPNPISYYLHQSPEVFHKFETLSNHFIELVAPPLVLLPGNYWLFRRLRLIGGFLQVLFQVILIISGNLSFLNWLTILPSICCFDDASLSWMFSNKRNSVKWQVWQIQQEEQTGNKPRESRTQYIRKMMNVTLAILLAYLSVPVVQNLLSSRQAMNTSFEPLRILNTYGAFGSITKDRTEVIIQGTYDNPQDPSAKWLEYEFKCKPGDVYRRPCLISPYHYRLDWLMWFAAFQNYQHNPWLVHLAAQLLVNDEGASSLIAHNPFLGKAPPKFIRAEHYRYRYTKLGSKDALSGAWWKRKRFGNYLPPVSLAALKEFLTAMDWPIPLLKA
ncbi:lipase maturation factor 1-like [Lingula anatina]|uniref:Lipase maturation factor n=1 Tax=Lingula anatina TaxID=7574 RepID=A0A1S3H7P2_LINAN|nr:lipase maturation factor 1-like [Lingula anatina]|eukprot:XP_013382135.1 lipase maturation factor 1-like [Lingula anatina]